MLISAGDETTGHSERKRTYHLERLDLRELQKRLALQLLGAHSLQLGVELRGGRERALQALVLHDMGMVWHRAHCAYRVTSNLCYSVQIVLVTHRT